MILSNVCIAVNWYIVYTPKWHVFANGEFILQSKFLLVFLTCSDDFYPNDVSNVTKSWFWFCSPTFSYPNRLSENTPAGQIPLAPRLVVYQQNLAPMCDALRDIGVQCHWEFIRQLFIGYSMYIILYYVCMIYTYMMYSIYIDICNLCFYIYIWVFILSQYVIFRITISDVWYMIYDNYMIYDTHTHTMWYDLHIQHTHICVIYWYERCIYMLAVALWVKTPLGFSYEDENPWIVIAQKKQHEKKYWHDMPNFRCIPFVSRTCESFGDLGKISDFGDLRKVSDFGVISGCQLIIHYMCIKDTYAQYVICMI